MEKKYKLAALYIIELMILFPFLHVYALTINDVTVTPGQNFADLNFSTDIPANATLLFGVYGGTPLDRTELSNPELSQEHHFSLSNLMPGQRYAYEVIAYSGSTRKNRVGFFIIPDANPPPQPGAVTVTDNTLEEVRLEWSETRSVVSDFQQFMIYRNGENIANTSSSRYTDKTTEPLTTYLYQLAIRDNTGNIGPLSSGVLITTPEPDVIAPTISNARVAGTSNTSGIVFWQTDEASSSIVYFGRGIASEEQNLRGSNTNHTVALSRLETNQQYSIIASSCDTFDNCVNSSLLTFTPGGDYEAPSLEANVPEIHNANRLIIEGTTEALARVFFYVNNFDYPTRGVQASIDGSFSTDVILDVTREENNIKIEAIDYAGNTQTKQFSVRVDAETPVAQISEIPTLVTQGSFTINGNVSERVTLNVYVETEQDSAAVPPGRVNGITGNVLSSRSTALEWEQNNRSDDVDFYRIYRGGNLVGTSKTTRFTDCVDANTDYTYQVSAVSSACLEGLRSDTVGLSTEQGSGCSDEDSLIEETCSLRRLDRSVQINEGSFSQSIRVEEGRNIVILEFVDEANNTVTLGGNVLYDLKAPRILETNLNDLSPAYDYELTITGKVDENATVSITVNEGSVYTGLTDKEGNFAIDIELEQLDYDTLLEESRSRNQVTGRATLITGRQTNDLDEAGAIDQEDYFSYQSSREDLITTSLEVAAQTGKFQNLIQVVATDTVGRESDPVERRIEYLSCSQGNAWAITLSDVQPGILIPRLLLNGVAQVTFNYELEWVGGTGEFDNEEIPRVSPTVSFRDLSRADEENWDTDFFNRPRVIKDPNSNGTRGYIIIQSRRLDSRFGNDNQYRRELARAVENEETDDFVTRLEMEQNVSKNRQGECIIPGFGCIKLPIQMELRYTDPVLRADRNNVAGFPVTNQRSASVTQRQCWDIEVGIDQRIDTDIIPDSFLRSAIDFLNTTIELVDQVLEPINKIKEYVLYACLGSWVILYVKALDKRYACEFKGDLGTIFGGSGFKTAVAEQGLCKAVYPTNTGSGNGDSNNNNGAKQEACLGCTEKVEAYNEFVQTMQFICDRIGCPSAPSLVEYIKKKEKDLPKYESVTVPSGDGQSTVFRLEEVSDCKYVDRYDFTEIESLYKDWLAYKNGESGSREDGGTYNDDGLVEWPNPKETLNRNTGTTSSKYFVATCVDSHMPRPECCIFEYMEQYDSVCGLRNGALFDEAKESYCVAGRFVGESVKDQELYTQQCEDPAQRTFDALAGICENNAGQEIDLINSQVRYELADANSRGDSGQLRTGYERENERRTQGRSETGVLVYQEVENNEQSDAISAGDVRFSVDGECPLGLRDASFDSQDIYYRVMRENEEGTLFYIQRGVVLRNIDIDPVDEGPLDPESYSRVGSSMVFKPLSSIPDSYFRQGEQNAETQTSSRIANEFGFNAFREDMIKCALDGTYTQRQIEETYNDIRASMGIEDKPEIVDPASSFLRSVQCLCLPGITGFLKLWRAIMVAVKACFQTILLTGDGNPGICQAVLTQYVCDIIYDLISCFTTKYSAGAGSQFDASDITGNLLGTLTSAGRDVQRTISSRYGDKGFYRALFSERQLVHAMCLWFFTGTFDFDFNALVEGEYGDVPVASQGLLAPCQRRFISYNSASQGRATWNYYFGVGLVAGAQLNYQVSLQCSEDFSCDYGYGKEQCDCADIGEKRRRVALRGAPSSLDRYDIVESTFDGTFQDDVRYDKVILEYTYIDKDRDRVKEEISCDIRQVGGEPPAFCQYDVGLGIYRCGFDIGQEDFAELLSVTDPKQANGWRPGEILTVLATVSQKLPDSLECTSAATCPSTKYLAMELRDQNGNTVIEHNTEGSYRPLLQNGVLTYSLPALPITISSSDVAGVSPTQGRQCIWDPQSFINGCQGEFPSSQTDSLTFRINNDASKTVVINDVALKEQGTGNDCTLAGEDGKLITKRCVYSFSNGNQLIINVRSHNGNNGPEFSSGSTSVLRTSFSRTVEQSGGNLCGGSSEVVWQGKVAIYDSFGDGFYEKSDNIYTYNGRKQEQPFSIRVICDEEGSDSTSETTTEDYGIQITSETLQSVNGANKVYFALTSAEDLRAVTYIIQDGSNVLFSGSMIGQGTNFEVDTSNAWTQSAGGNLRLIVSAYPKDQGDTAELSYTLYSSEVIDIFE